MSINISLPPIPKFPPLISQNFSKSPRGFLLSSSTSPIVGPGSYELSGSIDKTNVISFFPEDGSIMRKLKNNDDFLNPGPADYFLKKQEKKGKSLVFMDNLKNTNDQKGIKHINPGPGEYFKEESNLSKTKDKISFSQAKKKTFEIKEIEFPGPGNYDFDEKSLLMTKKNANKVAFSFSKEKKMVLPQMTKGDCSEIDILKKFTLDENSLRSLFDFKGKKERSLDNGKISKTNLSRLEEISVLDKYIKTENNEDIFSPTNHSSSQEPNNNFSSFQLKTNKSETKSNFSKSRRPIVNNSEVPPSILSKTRKNKKIVTLLKSQISTHKGLKKLLQLKKKNLFTQMDSTLIKKKTNENPLRKFMENEIAKKINEKIEKKMIKEIFLLSSDVEEKRKNRGFTQSVRKFEFLNTPVAGKLPGPANYTIKRELSSNGASFPLMKKKTIFDVGELLINVGPGMYELPSIFDLKKRNKEKIDKNLNFMLKKVEDVKKMKKNMKKEET